MPGICDTGLKARGAVEAGSADRSRCATVVNRMRTVDYLGNYCVTVLNRMEQGIGGLEIAVQHDMMHQFYVTSGRYVHCAPPRTVDGHNITRRARFDHGVHGVPKSQRTG